MAELQKSTAQIIPFPKDAPSRAAIDQTINRLRTARAAREIDQSMERRAYLAGYLDATLKLGGHHA